MTKNKIGIRVGDAVRITTPGREVHIGRVLAVGDEWTSFHGEIPPRTFALETQTIRNSAVVRLREIR